MKINPEKQAALLQGLAAVGITQETVERTISNSEEEEAKREEAMKQLAQDLGLILDIAEIFRLLSSD